MEGALLLKTSRRATSVANHSLHFIFGKHKGGHYSLTEGDQLMFGNASDVDIVLRGDLVSKKHAMLRWEGEGVFLKDLGSIYGTYVNGDKITEVKLEDGDEILLGTNLIKFAVESFSKPPPLPQSEASPPKSGKSTLPGLFTGDLEDVKIAELLQMLAISQRSGILHLNGAHEAEIHIRDGHIYWAKTSRFSELSPNKAIHRILDWKQGTFGLTKAKAQRFDDEITDPIDAIILEHIQQEDLLAELQDRAPSTSAKLQPILSRSGQPDPTYRNIYALICNDTYTVQELLDQSQDSDAETMRQLVELLEQGWVKAK